MTIQADQPGVQFYTTNLPPDPTATPYDADDRQGRRSGYQIHEALALETQKHPNAINFPASVTPGAEDEIIRSGETYWHTMIHKFTAEWRSRLLLFAPARGARCSRGDGA